MTISKRQTAPDLIDVQIALGKLLGLTDEEVAKRVCTEDKPQGISVRTLANRKVDKKAFIEAVIQWGLPLVRDHRESIEEITKDKYKAELEKLRGEILTVRKAALKGSDLSLANRVADTIEDRLDGRAINRLETLGLVQHQHTISDETIARLESFMGKHAALLPASEPKVIDIVAESTAH